MHLILKGERKSFFKEAFGLKLLVASVQDGGIGKHGSPLHTSTSKLQLKYRTTSLRTIRNQAEWKSDNYGIKETTSIETGRRGADVEWARFSPTCGG